MNLSHILNHLGEERDHYYNAVSPPVFQTSNFVFPTIQSFREAIADEMNSHLYTRGNNPTVSILRKKLAALEGAEDALVFGSGCAAIAAAVMSQVQSGDHIVCVKGPYSWTKKLLTTYLARFGVTHTFVDGTDMQAIAAAIQSNTKVLYLESPNSITFELQDLTACATLAKRHGLTSIIDNSYASPLFQQPIQHGIDIVVHSGTKYLNGHSDVVVGVLCSSITIVRHIFSGEYMTIGSIIGPQDAALMIRGLRTLPLRLQRSHETALSLASFLESHPKVEKVLHPFLPSFPQHDLAKRQMTGCGGLFSIILKAERIEQAETFFNSLQCFLLAVSWGGHESLVMPFCAFHDLPGQTEEFPITWKLVRFYIGLEELEVLQEDLVNALDKMG